MIVAKGRRIRVTWPKAQHNTFWVETLKQQPCDGFSFSKAMSKKCNIKGRMPKPMAVKCPERAPGERVPSLKGQGCTLLVSAPEMNPALHQRAWGGYRLPHGKVGDSKLSSQVDFSIETADMEYGRSFKMQDPYPSSLSHPILTTKNTEMNYNVSLRTSENSYKHKTSELCTGNLNV